MWGNTFILLLFLYFSAIATAQPPSSDAEFEAAYQNRIQKEYLYNVYIPKDLADSFFQLNRLIDKKSITKFKNLPENIASHKLHFSLGRWIVYNWGFYDGSRFSHYLRNLGIYHPDDMAQFVIISYHRNLNKNKLKIEELIEQFQTKRNELNEKRLNNGTIIFEERRKRNDEKKNEKSN